MENTKCVGLGEDYVCENDVYENQAEVEYFEKRAALQEGFVMPKRCRACRSRAAIFFAKKKAEKQDKENGQAEMQKFPHSRAQNSNNKNDYEVR